MLKKRKGLFINRTCINFDKLMAFRRAHGLDVDKYSRVMKKSR